MKKDVILLKNFVSQTVILYNWIKAERGVIDGNGGKRNVESSFDTYHRNVECGKYKSHKIIKANAIDQFALARYTSDEVHISSGNIPISCFQTAN